MIVDQLHNRLLTKSAQEFKKMRRQRASDSYVWAGGCAFRRIACAWRSLGVLTDGGRRWFPCLVYVKTPNIPHKISVVVLRNQLSKLNRGAPTDPTPLQNCQNPPRFVQTTAFGAISHHHDLDWSTSKYSIYRTINGVLLVLFSKLLFEDARKLLVNTC